MSTDTNIWEVEVGEPVTAHLEQQPVPTVGLGARIEAPYSAAIVAYWQAATFNPSTGVWTVTLDDLIDEGAYNFVWMTPDHPTSFKLVLPIVARIGAGDDNVPLIDRDAITPSVDDIARKLQTRTRTDDGEQRDTFTSETDPTEAQVAEVIEDAVEQILGRLPDQVDVDLYPRIKYAVSLQAAILVEATFFRQQEGASGGTSGVIRTYTRLLTQIMDKVVGQVDRGGTGLS